MAAVEPYGFDEQEVKLLGEPANDLAYCIANLRILVNDLLDCRLLAAAQTSKLN